MRDGERDGEKEKKGLHLKLNCTGRPDVCVSEQWKLGLDFPVRLHTEVYFF